MFVCTQEEEILTCFDLTNKNDIDRKPTEDGTVTDQHGISFYVNDVL